MRTCGTCGQRFSGEATFCPFDGTKLEGAGPATQMALQRPTDEIGPGTIIGNTYRVDRLLGEGGMGQVFAVTHLKLNKKFALKLLKKEMSRDPETRARFLNEAQAAGQIRHPNVVEVTDFASLPDGNAYMVMEYLDGQPLARMIKLGGALPAMRAVSIIRDVASALQAAHDAGVVHRDLKPDNVFVLQVAGRELAKILDFGVAKVAGSAKLTRTGIVFGTPHYMSPEQASGGAIGPATDIYALGVIMYEMFTGRVPFEADTYMGVLTKHMFETPVPPSQLPGPARELGALEDVTLRALAKRPEDRYASMLELAQDLDRLIQVGPDGLPKVSAGARVRKFGSEAPTRPMLNFVGLADELEPPAREEIGLAHDEDHSRRVRQIAFATIAILCGIAGVTTAFAITRSRRTAAGDSIAEAPVSATNSSSATASSKRVAAPKASATEATTTEASSGSTDASTAPSMSASVEPPRPKWTPPPSTAPPVTKPPPHGNPELDDPWRR